MRIIFISIVFVLIRILSFADCTQTINSDYGNGSLTLNDNDTLCINAIGKGNIDVNYERINFNGNAGLKIFTGENDTVKIHSKLNFWSGHSEIINYGNTILKNNNEKLRYSNTTINNYGYLNFKINVKQNGGNLINYQSGIIDYDSEIINVNGNNFTNKGKVNLKDAHFEVNSLTNLVNIGIVNSDTTIEINGTNIDLSGGVFDVKNFISNGGNFRAGTNGQCGAVYVEGYTELSATSNVNEGLIELNDKTGIDENNCGGDSCGFDIVNTINCNNVLPVKFVYFDGEYAKDGNFLKWKTSSEINNDYFIIEKSLNGISFNKIDIVDGNGNTSETVSYNYIDKLNKNNYYYRLKQVDYDGNYSYSNIIYLGKNSIFKNNLELNIYPIPVKNKINIFSNFKIKNIKIYNSLGQLINFYKITNKYNVTIELKESFNNSFYYLKIYFINNKVVKRKILFK